MSKRIGRRPKLVFYPTKARTPTAGRTVDDFEVYASYRGSAGSGFYGTLKVVRKTDGRLLFPFEGAETIGPFSSSTEAIEAARLRGNAVVIADIACPEL